MNCLVQERTQQLVNPYQMISSEYIHARNVFSRLLGININACSNNEK